MNLTIFISLLTGALVGALAKEVNVWLEQYRTDKRALKLVLYYQLDFWFELWRSDLGLLMRLFAEEMQAAFLRLGATPEQVTFMSAQVQSQVIALLTEARITEPQARFDRYAAAVEALAAVDPLTAYELSFRYTGEAGTKIAELISRAREMEEATEQAATDAPIIDELFTQMAAISNRELITSLERDIRRVARRVSWRTWYGARRVISGMEAKQRAQTRDVVEAMLAKLLTLVEAAGQLDNVPQSPRGGAATGKSQRGGYHPEAGEVSRRQ